MIAFNSIHAYITWELSDDGTLTISGTDMENYSTNNYYAPWYSQREYIKKVVIENGVSSIGDCAFYDCKYLNSVFIPNSISYIGKHAFSGCISITSILIPNSVTSIKTGTFRGCKSLTSVNIPNSVIDIGMGAFSGCKSLTSIYIPNSVTNIGSSAFQECTSLTSIYIPNSVTIIGGAVFRDCSSLMSVRLSESIKYIGYELFGGCSSLTSIYIPNSVTTIYEWAFSGCQSLTFISIPNSVTTIKDNAFYNCRSLLKVACNAPIPPKIRDNAFYYARCQFGTMYVPSNSISTYKSANGWNSWKNIKAIENVVTLNHNDGTDTSEQITAFYGQPMPENIELPQKKGHTFLGYFTGQNGTGIKFYNTDMTSAHDWDIAENITLYAHWEATTYRIELRRSSNGSIENYVYVTYGQNMPLVDVNGNPIKVPKMKGYTFKGYYRDSNFYYDDEMNSIHTWDRTDNYLIAKWKANITNITLDFQGGYDGTSQVTATYGKAMPIGEKIIAPTKTGYIFEGYYSSVNGKGTKYYDADMISTCNWNNDVSSSILYANWILYVPVSTIYLDDITNPLWVGETKTITAITTPTTASNTTVTWSSSNNNVATVSSKGVITAKGKGTCTITCTAADGYGAKSTCEVTVKQQVTDISLSETNASLWVGDTKTLIATASPTTASNTSVEWSSSDNNVATVSSKGVVTAKEQGTCIITCTAADGYGTKSTCEVTVKQQVTEIALSETTVSLWVGDTKTLTATASPTTASNTSVKWSSSDNKVAIVSSKGVITAKGKGTCTITCMAADGFGTKSTCEVTVKQQVTELALSETTTSLWVGDTKTITATASPTTASNTSVEWSSSDNNVATVSSEGVITANGEGTCIITCTAADGYGTKSTCEVTVKQQVTEIAINETTVSLWVGDTKTITATALPTTASNTFVEWSSSDENIASVSSEGVITAKGEGSCIITCTAADGYGTKSICEVTVKQQVTEIAINETIASLWVGDTKTITATASPTTASNTTVAWSSSDENVASVSSEGVITANGEGSCIITCTASDGYGTKSTCEITVKQQVTEIVLSETSASLWVGDTKTITATVSPTTASNTSVEWSSSDDNVATVSSDGVITAKGEGTCTITCTAVDGYGTKSTCEVIVKQQVTEIALSETTASLWVGDTKTITATALPTTANSTSVEWTSSDDKVASVSSEGVITANGEGACIITCTAADGYGAVSVCEVTVMQQTTSLEDLRFANDKSPVYNLNGQRISKAHAQKGIYIKNGKKYANKN